ncbi:aldolase [Stereum hirsutum FP-91666 SS1]|uniref:aldolase n=1 Tax=Stereum hirsutum (strain FP-91666) TaxID=721885 RepID=UPI000440C785|nr:aldolase [Stereum hirsutum FP-91666 SS1]EIM87073.1 aldolase [Stereum hirsutum FP-91666 SS1]
MARLADEQGQSVDTSTPPRASSLSSSSAGPSLSPPKGDTKPQWPPNQGKGANPSPPPSPKRPKDPRTKRRYLFDALKKRRIYRIANTVRFDRACPKIFNATMVTPDVLAELGHRLMEEVHGHHFTFIDAHLSHDVKGIVWAAQDIVSRFGKLGRGRDAICVGIPAMREGIEACKILEYQHDIHVNLTSISSLIHAAACAEAGATAITVPISKMTSRQKGRKEVMTGPVLEEIRAIKAFYALHEIPTMVIAGPAEHARELCALASLDGLAFTDGQGRWCEQWNSYPKLDARCSDSTEQFLEKLPSPIDFEYPHPGTNPEAVSSETLEIYEDISTNSETSTEFKHIKAIANFIRSKLVLQRYAVSSTVEHSHGSKRSFEDTPSSERSSKKRKMR